MRRAAGGAALACVLVGSLTSCGGTVSDSYEVQNDPASIVELDDGTGSAVQLTSAAVRRLGIETTGVSGAGGRLSVPSTAVFVDPDATWWVYTPVQPTLFVRHQIVVAEERGGMAYLETGPAAGTQVVTVGVAELAGIEAGIDH